MYVWLHCLNFLRVVIRSKGVCSSLCSVARIYFFFFFFFFYSKYLISLPLPPDIVWPCCSLLMGFLFFFALLNLHSSLQINPSFFFFFMLLFQILCGDEGFTILKDLFLPNTTD
eukprot:TRINITY_DN2327_c1_g1_i2.p1 TRINITY_DN2327_c1_g1~~TRINITY_DN2327_c1_g1_i2.p1  ORF type:complete len:114 (+),score=3.97 TRINITY_DN2327_c1_g1_i2:434-775(+)